MSGYNFAYLDEATKRMIRRAILKALAIPGHQIPFGAREMPLPYGWGTGGIQVTAAILGTRDVLKVIDQGADDTTNAVSIRRFFARVAGVATTTRTAEATVIQTRHRIPERPLTEGQVMVFQVPMPEPLFRLEPRLAETRRLHALGDYSLAQLRLYEDIARQGEGGSSYNHPVMVGGRYLMSPSPIPGFDNPKLDRSPAIMLFGAGREKKIYAVPPYTEVRSLDFETIPSGPSAPRRPAPSAAAMTATWTRSWPTTRAGAATFAPTPIIALSTRHDAAAGRRGPAAALRRDPCAGRRVAGALAGRGSRHRGRERLRQVHPAARPRRAGGARWREGAL
jgi:alpha-D-ribose 1-methylphosphonate 5-phosphate C-P lyase